MEQLKSLLTPKYMSDFSCIGPECSDNCCETSWDISIDKKTYLKYQNVDDHELAELIKKHITIDPSHTCDEDYAKINFFGHDKCPFLEQGLCSIQKRYGEKAIGNVCCTYPRYGRIVNHTLEESASVSCPEVTRVALLNKDGIEFEYKEIPPDKRFIIVGIVNNDDTSIKNTPRQYLWEIRSFAIDIIQNRSYTLEERLLILGFFMNKLNSLCNKTNMQKIPGLINSYGLLITDGSIKDLFGSIPSTYTVQMALLTEIMSIRFQYDFDSKAYLDCFDEFMEGLNFTKETDAETIIGNYIEAGNKHYKPFMAEHEYILENYLVNYLFRTLFPFGGGSSVFDDYTMLVLHYALIKIMLVGMSGFHKGLTVDLVLKLIQSFSKTVEHSLRYLGDVYNVVKANKYDTLAHMAILIRN